jgi:hypothetical protein
VVSVHYHLAQGAFVCTSASPLCDGGDCEDAHGALVGVIGPGGPLEVSEMAEGILVAPPGIPSLLAVAHGAAVPPVGGTARVPAAELAHGAWVPDPGVGRGVAMEA